MNVKELTLIPGDAIYNVYHAKVNGVIEQDVNSIVEMLKYNLESQRRDGNNDIFGKFGIENYIPEYTITVEQIERANLYPITKITIHGYGYLDATEPRISLCNDECAFQESVNVLCKRTKHYIECEFKTPAIMTNVLRPYGMNAADINLNKSYVWEKPSDTSLFHSLKDYKDLYGKREEK